jgi:hypothetical protein
MSNAARIARYRASSPDDTEILRTKGARVPNMIMERVREIRARFVVFI